MQVLHIDSSILGDASASRILTAAIVDELRKIGRLAGLDNETLDECLKDGEKAEALVAWYTENSKEDDISSTPSFVIDGKKHSNMSYADMKELLDDALAG